MGDNFIEIKQSGPDVPDGVYPMVLVDIKGDPEHPNQPRHVVPDKGPNAGTDLYFWDWAFRINIPGDHPLNATEPFEYGTSTKTGPRSKMYGLLTALLNGAKPAMGMQFSKEDLIGRQVHATVQHDEAGYCEIVSFSAIPAHLQQQAFAAQTGAPTQGTPVAPPAAAAPIPGVQPGPAPEQQFRPQQIVPPMPAGFAGQVPTPAPAQANPEADLPF